MRFVATYWTYTDSNACIVDNAQRLAYERSIEFKSAKSLCEDCNINSIDVDGKWTINL